MPTHPSRMSSYYHVRRTRIARGSRSNRPFRPDVSTAPEHHPASKTGPGARIGNGCLGTGRTFRWPSQDLFSLPCFAARSNARSRERNAATRTARFSLTSDPALRDLTSAQSPPLCVRIRTPYIRQHPRFRTPHSGF